MDIQKQIRIIFNAGMISLSYAISLLLKKPIVWGMPISISVEPTNICNLRCPECPTGTGDIKRPKGFMDTMLFKKIIDQLHPSIANLIMNFQGEPFLNKEFLAQVKYAKSKNIYTNCSTNGQFIDDDTAKAIVLSGMDRITISIDGATQKVYETYRKGGSLEFAKEGAQKIYRWKQELGINTPKVVIQFLVFSFNEHQIGKMKKLKKQVGANKLYFKTAQVHDFENGNPLLPIDTNWSRYTRCGDGKFVIKTKLSNKCFRLWSSTVITWDGNIVPCCFDKDANHIMGNLYKTSFNDIWKGKYYRSFRKKLLVNRKTINICTNCSQGLSDDIT